MKATRHFLEDTLRDRPEIRPEWCERVIARAIAEEVQSDGRVRFWGELPEFGGRVLRVVTLADRETLHTAFFTVASGAGGKHDDIQLRRGNRHAQHPHGGASKYGVGRNCR